MDVFIRLDAPARHAVPFGAATRQVLPTTRDSVKAPLSSLAQRAGLWRECAL